MNLAGEENIITQKYRKWENLINSNSNYKNGILGILDIIGFSKYVLEKKTDFNTIVKIIANNAFTNDVIFDKKNIDIRILSDTMVVFMEDITAESVIIVIKALENFRLGFLKEGFITRGAIVSGPYFWEKDILVSPAFIEAYNLEEKKAIYPRIIIKDDLVQLLDKNHKKENDILLIGNYDYPKDLIYRDFDFYYVIRPFIIIDNIAFYCYENYINKYTSSSNKMNERNLTPFENLLSEFKKEIEVCSKNTHSDHEREKINYLISEYNKLLDLCKFYPYRNKLEKIQHLQYSELMYK